MPAELEFNPEAFLEEYNMLKNQLQELNDLYDEIKAEKDAVWANSHKRSYVFIASQNSSLISIKSNIQAVVSRLFDMRAKIEDFKIKYQNMSSDKEMNQNSAEILKQLFADMNKSDGATRQFLISRTESISTTEKLDPVAKDVTSLGDFLDASYPEEQKDEGAEILKLMKSMKLFLSEDRTLYHFLPGVGPIELEDFNSLGADKSNDLEKVINWFQAHQPEEIKTSYPAIAERITSDPDAMTNL